MFFNYGKTFNPNLNSKVNLESWTDGGRITLNISKGHIRHLIDGGTISFDKSDIEEILEYSMFNPEIAVKGMAYKLNGSELVYRFLALDGDRAIFSTPLMHKGPRYDFFEKPEKLLVRVPSQDCP